MQGVGTADNLVDLVGDACLTDLVVVQVQLGDELSCVVRRVAHGVHARTELTGSSLQKRCIDHGDKVLGQEEAKVVSAEIDRQRIAEELRRELHPVPVDYAGLAYTAEVRYGESLYEPGVLGKVGEALMVGYAMIVMAFRELFETLGT